MHAAGDDGSIGERAAPVFAPAGDMLGAAETAAPRLLEVVRERIRYRHFSYRTEQAYAGWVRRYIGFHGRRHPREMGAPEI